MDSAPLRTLVETAHREGGGELATTAPNGAPEAALVGVASVDDGTLIVNAPSSARKVAIRPEWMRDYDVEREPRTIETAFATA